MKNTRDGGGRMRQLLRGSRLSVAVALATVVPLAAAYGEVTNPNGVAVIIGNKSYEHERVPEVSYAHRDATAFKRYVTDVLGFDPLNVIELNDAGQADLETAFGNERSHEGLLWSFLDPEGGSDVVVFYSGHGVPGLQDGRGYLLPSNGHPDTAEINGYPIDLLYENLGKLEEARSVVVYLDACFSGDSHDGMLIRSASPVYLKASVPTALEEKVTVLTASSGTELASWDEVAQHGLFTNHLLDALYGKGDADGDGQVTAGEVAAYLRRHMTRAARRLFRRHQNASLSGVPGVVLARAVDGVFPPRVVLSDSALTTQPAPDSDRPSPLPPAPDECNVQCDKYLLGMKLSHEERDAEKVLEYRGRLQELGVALPLEVAYYSGQAFIRLGRHQDALAALESYVERSAKTEQQINPRKYREVLGQILDIEERLRADDGAYQEAKRTNTAQAYDAYLRAHPQGTHVEEALQLKAEAQDEEAWRRARRTDTVAAYEAYVIAHPKGRHREEARRLQEQRRDQARRWAHGRRFQDCATCPKMVVVQAGTFMMGSPHSEPGRQSDEGPQQRITFGQVFAVGVFEVTFDEWDSCVQAGSCNRHRPNDNQWGRGNRPVINISWHDANAYVRWLSAETGEEYRLPSESEWEYVARAGTTTAYHFGRTIPTNRRSKSAINFGLGRTRPVGEFGPNGFGLHDVHGNVWEWTQDCWNATYAGGPLNGNPRLRGDCSSRVVRGGSWRNDPDVLRSANRGRSEPGTRSPDLGFRVVRTIPS